MSVSCIFDILNPKPKPFPHGDSVWDMATGKEMSKLEGHSDTVASVAISKDGKTIVSGSYDKTIR